MTKITNIAKNTSYLTLALIMQKVISFTYFTLLARNLGPEDLGKYYFAISFTTIFAIFIDLGLINVLTREVAKSQERAKELLGSVLVIKIPLAALALLVVGVMINLMDYPEITRNLVYLSSACMVLDSFTTTFFAVIRGFHNLKFESIAAVAFQLIIMAFGLTALYSGQGLYWIMGALVMASTFNFIYSFLVLWRKMGIKIRPVYDRALVKLIMHIAIPFGLYAVFQRVYTYLDSVLLSIMAGDKYVGLYQIAFKIIFALQFLPLAFTASLYPAMSSYWVNNRKQLSVSFERAMNYLIIISLPITVGTIVTANKIILVFKSGFAEAVLPMQIIIASLVFLFVNFPIGSLLNACDRQKTNTINMGIVMAFSVVLNLFLISRFQAIGASLTVLFSNILMFILGIYWVGKIIDYRKIKIILVFLKSLIAAGLMGGLVLYFKPLVNIFILVPSAAILYFILLFLLGGFKKEDIISIYKSFAKKQDLSTE
ncbi:MAG: flippase [Patescibacteria group bacterium]|nr:flippase [Patescibacteria group bacterium]MDD5294848.1 flippase [Patescibacteria group bacterium]MDD5554854.1 flippase [Patescibacteria group bacterium]